MLRWQLAVLACCVAGSAVAAEDESRTGLREWLNASGSLRGAYFSSSRELDDRQNLGAASVWLRAAPKLGDAATMTLEGWSRDDGGRRQSHLREGYINVRSGPVDLRVGQQIIAWGRADELNPTDNLSPRDFTLLTPESDDQRLGTAAARLTYHFGDYAMTAIWLPSFRSNVIPIPHTPGVDVARQVPDGQGAAFKLERSGTRWEGSLSFYDGLDVNPDLVFLGVNQNAADLALRNHRIRVFGGDVATVAGPWGLRGEAAYTWTSYDPVMRPLVKKPFFYGVAGADRTFDNGIYVNVQYYLRHISNFQDPGGIGDPLLREIAVQSALTVNQRDRFEHGLSLRLSDKWFNNTLEAELAAVVSLTRGDQVWRPKVIYAINDQLKLTVGVDVFAGGSNTFYGRLRDNSAFYVEMKYGL
ncbi:MAG: hypothetical protein JWP60_3563 [Ramlibacter sp.]|nr:hypothetical protein [Ramlibacter sp.]